MPSLVIVESPTKARTIRNYLPADYQVEASMGHVRDLPQSASEIPASVKGEDWAKIGVNVGEDFEPLYVIPQDKKKVVKALKDALKNADELVLGGVRYAMFATTKRVHPLEQTIECLGNATGLSWKELLPLASPGQRFHVGMTYDSRRERVREWLLPRAGLASGLAVREAIRHLPEEDRAAILAARDRGRRPG